MEATEVPPPCMTEATPATMPTKVPTADAAEASEASEASVPHDTRASFASEPQPVGFASEASDACAKSIRSPDISEHSHDASEPLTRPEHLAKNEFHRTAIMPSVAVKSTDPEQMSTHHIDVAKHAMSGAVHPALMSAQENLFRANADGLVPVPSHVSFQAKPHFPHESVGPTRTPSGATRSTTSASASASDLKRSIQEASLTLDRHSIHQGEGPSRDPLTTPASSTTSAEKMFDAEPGKRRRLNHQAAGYNAAGGINCFAAQPTSNNDAAKHRQSEAPPAIEIPLLPVEEANARTNINIRIGVVGSTLHTVMVHPDTTVGQLALAEGKVLDPNITWRPTDAWGLQLKLYDKVSPGQIVFLSDAAKPLPPVAISQEVCQMGCPDAASRIELLWNQRGWVGSDEMTYFLERLNEWGGKSCRTTKPIIATTLAELGDQFEEWVYQAIEQAHSNHNKWSIRTAVLLDKHWTPIKISICQDEVHFHTTPIGKEMLSMLSAIRHFDEAQWHTEQVISEFPYDCGFQTAAWLHEYDMGGIPTPMTVTKALAIRSEFEQLCLSEYVQTPVSGGVIDEKILKQLQDLIEAHGVSSERSFTCATNLINSLGLQNIIGTLKAPRPWRDLKTKASAHRPPIQIVLSEELHASIASKTGNGQSVGRKAAKKVGPPGPKPIVLKADHIAVPNEIFQQQDGVKLNQINMHQLHQGAKGVVVVNVQEALAFFQLHEPVSKEGVALLVIDHADSRIPDTKTIVQFPAHYCETNERILVTAALLQIGSKKVQRFRPDSCVKIDEVETQVVRILAYRDQIKSDWASLIQGPVKTVLSTDALSALPQDHILDIWDRQFLDKNFRKTAPQEAYLFATTIRLHSQAATEVLNLSGKDGVYSEPRVDTGRAPNPSYRVIWLPKRTFAEASLMNQTTPHHSWLVRNGDRFGIRVHEDDAATVHRLHRPELSYLDGHAVMSYKVGPLPWDTTKQGLQKAFQSWEWPARPGQPQGQSACGVFWTALATQHPSHWVFTMDHGDVLISHNDTIKDAKTSRESSVIASAKTLRHMTGPAKRPPSDNAEDPWLLDDPWASSPIKQAPMTLSNAQMAQMQSNIEQSIRESLPIPEDSVMESVHESRVATLEEQVKQLTTSVSQLTGSVSTINNQQHQLGSQVQKVQKQIDSQHASLHSMIDSKLEDQMTRIETLLSKRSKTTE
eukprot:s432_g8.t1